jgi:Mn2+/Fe2+ NRAMP family transporter
VKKIFELVLGIVTSIGGFLEVGSIATAAQAGATFNFQLVWPIALGTLCVIFLIEMSGRLAAVSHHPVPAAVRERFGIRYFAILLVAGTIVDLLVLSSEIGGASLGLQLLTGVAFRWWAIPVAVGAWLVLWNSPFSVIEYGVGLLGLVTLVFVVAAIKLSPPWMHVLKGVVPTLPGHDRVNYWFLVVSILGATISPYLFNFYSSGAVEEKWGEDDLTSNKIAAGIGMGFGGLVSIAVLITAAMVLHPREIRFDRYEQIGLMTAIPLGRWGYWLLGVALVIACGGAALELSLDLSYVYAQCFGWNWSQNQPPKNATRFSAVYSVLLPIAAVPILLNVDPLKLTLFSMAVTALVLPLVVLPFLVLMNDEHYVGKHRNGWLSNSVVFVSILLAAVIALVAIPLEIFGGS